MTDEQYQMLEKWRLWFMENAHDPGLEEHHFDALATGFFCALGATVDEAQNLTVQALTEGIL